MLLLLLFEDEFEWVKNDGRGEKISWSFSGQSLVRRSSRQVPTCLAWISAWCARRQEVGFSG